jgi:hypothetical protein
MGLYILLPCVTMIINPPPRECSSNRHNAPFSIMLSSYLSGIFQRFPLLSMLVRCFGKHITSPLLPDFTQCSHINPQFWLVNPFLLSSISVTDTPLAGCSCAGSSYDIDIYWQSGKALILIHAIGFNSMVQTRGRGQQKPCPNGCRQRSGVRIRHSLDECPIQLPPPHFPHSKAKLRGTLMTSCYLYQI